ncbi:hypothetical protein [Halorientalis salina]|uniref:hypothetical protein n=1 Tax=Halorientalis salina TaxID=2932266 RepID=UPI0010AD74D7|nr:hypothetical protein [Halorientalis salina]
MDPLDRFERLRGWFPIPTRQQGFAPIRWLLLEGNRYAVTLALLSITFGNILLVGSIWTLEMQQLLTETETVQTLLNTLLSGIILLVSIVVSINSIVLSYDITHVGEQEERIESALTFRRDVGQMADIEGAPTNPSAFLTVMAEVIRQRARDLEEVAEGADAEFAKEIQDKVEATATTAEHLEESLEKVGGAEFGVLWLGLEMDYDTLLDRSRLIATTDSASLSENVDEQFEQLRQAFELFATGREYFKTLYYSREISQLSRTLLFISLPAILVTATTILTISARLLPEVWMLGLPPLLTFVAATFTISLAPFIVLTAYMLRIATVAHRTAAAGPFTIRS